MTDLIKRLIASGEMVLYHDYRSRSLRDWSWQGNDGVAVNTPKWGGGNIRFDDLSMQSISVATSPTWNFTSFTLLALARQWRPAIAGVASFDLCNVISRDAAVRSDFLWRIEKSGANTVHYLYDETVTARGKIYNAVTLPRLMAISGGNGLTGNLYADGILVGALSGASSAFNTTQTQPIYIGNGSPAGTTLPLARLPLQATLVINRQLTATEHAQIYGELIAMNWESKPGKHAWRNTKPANVSANTIAQYEMVARGTTVADVSGNGRNGTLTNSPWMAVQTPVGRGFVFSRDRASDVGGYLDTGFGNATLNDTTDDKSCCLWVRSPAVSPAVAMNVLSRRSSTGLHGLDCDSNGTRNAFFFTSFTGTASEDSAQVTLQTGNHHHIGFTFNAATKAVQFHVDGEPAGNPVTLTVVNQANAANWAIGAGGRPAYRCFDGACVSPQFIKAIQDATWWKEQYRAGARAVQYAMGQGIETSLVASEGGVVGTYLSNSRWRFADATARVKVGIEQVNGQWMKTLEGVTAGYLYAPIESMLGNDAPNSSYGTWEWWQYKTDAGAITFAPVNTNAATPAAGTYYLEASATEAATLVEQGVGNVFSQASVFTHSVWQKVRLTRGYAGRWRLYVNDSFVIEATDNTSYTTNHWLLNLGVGCKIAGLTKYLGDLSV